ncbi:hypothetical protein [Brevibacterium aurantiacum]|uniref:Uncharacterized protein n=1 Tax=Brevibacterium aurantiacum TaxID=273384 RepID=A0A556CJF9_BREAU|nr:hypothetical protein [Brevibacterium aurantiacum]TSI17569.1 hypothetical protein FO013_04970 [Brevibacterium aurantiacum]
MRMAEEPTSSEHAGTSHAPRFSSIPRHIEEWLDTFFDGSPTVRFTCTPQFYDRMYFRLREAADSHGYDPDLVVGLGGALEFRRRSEEQAERVREQPREEVLSSTENEAVDTAVLAPDEYISRLEYLRDEIARDSGYRQEMACRAVATGIKKAHVYSNSGVTAPTLDKWLRNYTPQEHDQETNRLILRRLQVVNTRIRVNADELRELATEAAIATGHVAMVARAAGLSRQAIYRWLKIHHAAKD